MLHLVSSLSLSVPAPVLTGNSQATIIFADGAFPGFDQLDEYEAAENGQLIGSVPCATALTAYQSLLAGQPRSKVSVALHGVATDLDVTLSNSTDGVDSFGLSNVKTEHMAAEGLHTNRFDIKCPVSRDACAAQADFCSVIQTSASEGNSSVNLLELASYKGGNTGSCKSGYKPKSDSAYPSTANDRCPTWDWSDESGWARSAVCYKDYTNSWTKKRGPDGDNSYQLCGASEQCKYGDKVYNLNTWCTSNQHATGCSRLCWKPYKACFRRDDTTACRLASAAADASAAYSDCYGRARPAATPAGQLVRMEALRAGDHVLSVDAAGRLHADRVFINAHLDDARATAPFLTLHYRGGSLSITSGHTAWVEGAGLVSAHALKVGDGLRLPSGVRTVERITQTSGGIINPVTVSGYILAASGSGAPVRMSVVEEGGWDELLGSLGVVATPMLLLVSRIAPAQVQQMEWLLVDRMEKHVLPLLDSLPLPLVVLLALVMDVLLSCAVCLSSVGACTAAAAALVGVLALRKKGASVSRRRA